MTDSSCPRVEDLQRLLDDTLPEDLSATIGSHIEDCAGCQSLLDHLSSDAWVEDASGSSRTLSASEYTVRLNQGQLPKSPTGQSTPNRSTMRFPLPPMTSRGIGRIGRYEVLRQIASGGSGVLFEAWDSDLDRPVALKVLRFENAGDADSQQRLKREARVASELRHDHILPVYEFISAASDEFPPALVMKLLSGRTLADFARDGRKVMPIQAAKWIQQAARGVDAAHQAGLVHRDIKPSNLLIDEGNTDRVMVADFGLVSETDGNSDLTRTGDIAGTPAYMSPEQIEDARAIDARSDIYSLGCVLYQLLTGQAPFAGTVRMVLWQILNDEPKSPRSLDDQIPIAIENICLKAMSKDPRNRYDTAAAMADDVQRFVDGNPTIAKPVGVMTRVRRMLKQHPAAAATLGVTMISAVVIAAIASAAAIKLAAANAETRYQAAQSALDRDIALQAMETVVFTAYDELDADEFETDEIQIRLLEKAAHSLSMIEDRGDAKLLRYRAETHARLGLALQRSQQWDRALEHLSLASESLRQIGLAERETKPLRLLQLRIVAGQARVRYEMEPTPEMWPTLEQARTLADQMLADDPTDIDVAVLASDIFRDFGHAVSDRDGDTAAIPHYVRSLESHQRIGALDTISYYQRVSRLMIQNDIAVAYYDSEATESALKEFSQLQTWSQQCIAIDRRDEDPADLFETQEYLVEAYSGRSSCLADQGKLDEGLRIAEQGWPISEAYLQQRPLDVSVNEIVDLFAKNAHSIAVDANDPVAKKRWAKRLLDLATASHEADPTRATEKRLSRAKRRLEANRR
ncbi:Serine/threonine-protein kinase PrkC [Rubripirellula tenax]|uniref:non-specific serine/threonine protein kinase n=1 Tax=Rubripirellula tenax TaxID=2528015 RepID=A0A5C6F8P6_9BACT|nr:serine/threonine-protein kinase [Rubripirellula tenax]TWU56970.1 Serine/threonine-protein kinase PrkC [Rubripirellula tenax]